MKLYEVALVVFPLASISSARRQSYHPGAMSPLSRTYYRRLRADLRAQVQHLVSFHNVRNIYN